MEWPDHLLESLEKGIKVKLQQGIKKYEVVQFILDEIARVAIARYKTAEKIMELIDVPYPMITVVGEVVPFRLFRAHVDGVELTDAWPQAVSSIYEYIREHAAAICSEFADDLTDFPEEEPEDWEESDVGGASLELRFDEADDEDDYV